MRNSEGIDEGMKPWTKKMTQEDYDLRVLKRGEFCRRYKVTKEIYDERVQKLRD